MSQFQACRGCGATIHITATACPQCGAPTGIAPGVIPNASTGAPQVGVNTAAPVASAPSIPWFRKRWFAVLSVITITPIASLLALTGDVYYKNRSGEMIALPKNYKLPMILGTIPWLFMTFGGPSQVLLPAMALLIVGAVIGLKK
nr:hypothetical protein [uncultured Comamonas sp.]